MSAFSAFPGEYSVIGRQLLITDYRLLITDHWATVSTCGSQPYTAGFVTDFLGSG